MSSQDSPHPLFRAAAAADQPTETYAHPLNPRSEVRGVSLSEAVGLQRIGVHLITVAAGKEAFIYHSHACEEEFVYILAGRGVAEIDGAEYEVGPGDFMGFPTPSVAHHLRNPFDEDLVYISGGERRQVEVAEFPHLRKRLLRVGDHAYLADTKDFKLFWSRGDSET